MPPSSLLLFCCLFCTPIANRLPGPPRSLAVAVLTPFCRRRPPLLVCPFFFFLSYLSLSSVFLSPQSAPHCLQSPIASASCRPSNSSCSCNEQHEPTGPFLRAIPSSSRTASLSVSLSLSVSPSLSPPPLFLFLSSSRARALSLSLALFRRHTSHTPSLASPPISFLHRFVLSFLHRSFCHCTSPASDGAALAGTLLHTSTPPRLHAIYPQRRDTMQHLNHLYTTSATSPAQLNHELQPPLASVWQRHSSLQLACMVLSIFFWFFSFTAAFSAITISRWRYSGQHKRSQSSRLSKHEAPGVSILRPLRGIDCNMYENLASSFRQDYQRFEIIFSVAQKNDPAIAIVRALMEKYPRVDARLIIGERNVGINPKINNMIQSYESAKYDILWVIDSNVYVDPGCMGRSVDKMMQRGVGLVHHLPFGVRPQTLGSELELMFLDTVHAKMYLFINWTGLASCVVGKSSLYRRSDLDKVGGLARFGKYMAEDNLIATEIFNMGYKHEMTSDLAYQSLGAMTPSDYFLRRARWTRIRKYTVTAATVVEPFIEMIGCGLVASYGFNLLWQTHFLNFLAFHCVIWFLIDLSMYQALSGNKLDNLRGFLMAWSLRELAALPLYAYAVAGSTVDWRDQTFLLLRNGTVQPLAPAHDMRHSRTSRNRLYVDTSSVVSIGSSTTSSSASTATSEELASPTLSSAAAFAHLANTVVPQSAQASLRSFFRRPAVISIVSSTFAVVHFVVDILIKSQRNGNDDDDGGDLSEDDEAIESHHLEGEDISSDEQSAATSKLKRSTPLMTRPRRTAAIHGKGRKVYEAATDDLCDDGGDGDHSGAGESEAILLRRSARLRTRMESKLEPHFVVKATEERENNVEYGRRRSADEDALIKAVEPYLSDSLSRRGRIRRQLSSPSQFLGA
ncbi:unnamed protein product [Mortierella alpina]